MKYKIKEYKNTEHMQDIMNGYNYPREAGHQALNKGSIQAQKYKNTKKKIENEEIQKYQTHAKSDRWL